MDARPLGLKRGMDSVVSDSLETLGVSCTANPTAILPLDLCVLLPMEAVLQGNLPLLSWFFFHLVSFHSLLHSFPVGGQAGRRDPILAGSKSGFKGLWIASCLTVVPSVHREGPLHSMSRLEHLIYEVNLKKDKLPALQRHSQLKILLSEKFYYLAGLSKSMRTKE